MYSFNHWEQTGKGNNNSDERKEVRMKVGMFHAERERKGWRKRTHGDDIWMAQSKEQINLGSELLL